MKVSFEFFPPKTDDFLGTVEKLSTLRPHFFSVTYGAGGTSIHRDRTYETVLSVSKQTGVSTAAHMTCVGATRSKINTLARHYWEQGIHHIVALRGDMPRDAVDRQYVPHPGGYAYASDLVAGLKRVAPFEISVAAYPECHPEAPNTKTDIENLKRKIDAGATRAITQYFFDPEVYLRYLDLVRAAGIDVPIVPGILPVYDMKQLKRFSDLCGATIPKWLTDVFDGLILQPGTHKLASSIITFRQCFALYEHGIDEFHFYTLNRVNPSYVVVHTLKTLNWSLHKDG